jgi:anti-sigma regulatory factor (Ser/Thr protein kinase)
MAVVALQISPLPSHVRTARLVAVAAARRAGLPDELVDELRLALGEAASRAVGLHARHAPDVPVSVTVHDNPGGLTVSVSDRGPAAGPAPGELSEGLFDGAQGAGGEEHELLGSLVDPDVSLAVVTSLVDEVTVDHGAEGTTVTMRWPLPPSAAPGGTAVAAT